MPRFLETRVHGKTEKMNSTLKKANSKICQETNLKCNKVLSIALLRTRAVPRSRIQLTPDEMSCWRPSYVLERTLGKLSN